MADRGRRIGNCSGFYGDRLSAMREMLEGGDGSLDVPDRRLPRRADHADPRPGPAARTRRWATPAPSSARPRTASGWRWSAASGSSRTPAASTRPGSPRGCARSPPGSASTPRDRARRGRRPAPGPPSSGFARRADRERLPRRLRHRRRARRRRRHRGHRPGHRRLARGRAGDRALRLDPGRRTTSWPAPWSPGTSSSAAPRRPAATSPGFLDLAATTRTPLGFPLAEIAADGSCVITKHDGTGGAGLASTRSPRSWSTRCSRPHYLGPDVTTDLDTIAARRTTAPTGSRISGVRGSAPPEQLKVCVNELGGFRNQVEFVLTGLDIEEKAAWVRAQLEPRSPRPAGRRRVVAGPHRHEDADTEEGASCLLRLHGQGPVAGAGRQGVHRGRRSSSRSASYPGFTLTAPPARPRRTASTGRRTSTAARSRTRCTCRRPTEVAPTQSRRRPPMRDRAGRRSRCRLATRRTRRCRSARSCTPARGDKGGDANLGLWVAPATGDRRADDGSPWLLRARRPPSTSASCCPRPRTSRSRSSRCPTSAASTCDPRPARRGRRRAHPVRPAGQGARRVAASRYVDIPEDAAVTDGVADAWTDASSVALQETDRAAVRARARWRRTSRSGRTPARCRAIAAPRRREGRAARRLGFPEEVGGAGRRRCSTRWRCRRRSSRPAAPPGWPPALFTARHRAAAHRRPPARRPDRPRSSARRWPGRRSARSAITEPGGGSDVAGIRTDRRTRRRPLRRQRRQDVHHQRRARRLRHHRGAHRRARATPASACSSSRRARPASPSTGRWRRWAGTAPTPPSCRTSTCGCRPPTWSARRTPASTRSPSSSWSSGSPSPCTPTASRPASLALTAAYCRERETFGKPLIANQVVRHKLVEMHRQVEVARTLHPRRRRAARRRART